MSRLTVTMTVKRDRDRVAHASWGPDCEVSLDGSLGLHISEEVANLLARYMGNPEHPAVAEQRGYERGYEQCQRDMRKLIGAK